MNCLIWNVHSMKSENRCHEFLQYLKLHDFDILFITETWLPDSTNCASRDYSTATLTDYMRAEGLSYNFFSLPRVTDTCGGGVAIFTHSSLICKPCYLPRFTSFEAIRLSLKSPSSPKIVCLYRRDAIPFSTFVNEFTSFLLSSSISSSPLILCGDFNITINLPNDTQAITFSRIVSEFNLCVMDPGVMTHKSGNTIDFPLINTRFSERISNISVDLDEHLSDHFPVSFSWDVNPAISPPPFNLSSYRPFKSININQFKQDLAAKLSSSYPPQNLCRSLNDGISSMNNCIEHCLNNHAPLCSTSISYRHRPNWIDHEYVKARALRRKYERAYIKTHSNELRLQYVQQRKICSDLAYSKRFSYYSKLISNNSGNQRALYKIVNSLLTQDSSFHPLPHHTNQTDLANQFNHFFVEKISNLRSSILQSSFPVTQSSSPKFPSDTACYTSHTFHADSACSHDQLFSPTASSLSSFTSTNESEILSILKETGIKASPSDQLPAFLMKECADILVPYWTSLVNLSLSLPSFNGLKHANVVPSLKKTGLDQETLNNYRPISLLPFVSKLTERVVLKQLNAHMSKNNLHVPNQYGYKKHHSTETVLLKLYNDIMVGIDQKFGVVVLLIDLSAAFDTVDHKLLLNILEFRFHITSSALLWFKAFLTGRTQNVKIGESYSDSLDIAFGVPQGSVLGPVLFNMYCFSLTNTFSESGFDSASYADDNFALRLFSSTFQYEALALSLPACFSKVKLWMNQHSLKMNADKTQIIVFGNKKFLNQLRIKGTFMTSGVCVRFADSVKHLGVWLDQCLTLDKHISRIASACYANLRTIRSIRKFLNHNLTESLVHSLITCRLDMCNSIFFGMSKSNISKLQTIQNAALRLILKLKKHDSVSDHFANLHWLNIEQRIHFKILVTVFKCINSMAPAPLSNLLVIKNPTDMTLVTKLFFSSSPFGDRAFVYYAPRHWNALPRPIRIITSLKVFKGKVKNHLLTSFPCFLKATKMYSSPLP